MYRILPEVLQTGFYSHPISYEVGQFPAMSGKRLFPAMTARCGQARAGVNGAEEASSQSRAATTKSGRMQTAEMWSRCDNRPDRAALSPHTTGRFLLTIIATASRTGAFDYGHAPRIR